MEDFESPPLVSSMVLPTSMTPPGPESSSGASTSVNFDSAQSFKVFLDIITPLEFAELLRARVKHLLRTWPPKSASTIAATSSSSLTPSDENFPSFETVRAFAAFFRTQDSPGPSPIDLPTTTSLQSLRHSLLALSTLLSFLSARELQAVVRSRLTENGRDRSAAVQGLMDIMRNPGGGHVVLERLVACGRASHTDEDRGLIIDRGGLEDDDQPLMPAEQVSPSGLGKRKELTTSCEVMEATDEEEGLPPRKRKRDEHGTLEVSHQSTLFVVTLIV